MKFGLSIDLAGLTNFVDPRLGDSYEIEKLYKIAEMGTRRQYAKSPSEKKVKLRIGRWLQDLGCRIYDEKGSKLDSSWDTFNVQGVHEGKSPDLLARGILYSQNRRESLAYIALEIKVGWKHKEIVQGFTEQGHPWSSPSNWRASREPHSPIL